MLLLLVAATSASLKQLKTEEINEGNDEEHCKDSSYLLLFFLAIVWCIVTCYVSLVTAAKRQSLLEEIEREFEGDSPHNCLK